MADELGAELSLDLDAARREIESFRRDVEDELDRAVKTFADSYEDTVNRLPPIEPEIESQAVTEELNRAVAAADERLSVETDAAAITSDINEAVGATNAVVEVDTEPMVASLIDAVEGTHPVLEPEIDTDAARASLEDLARAFESGGVEGTALQTADFRAQELADSLGDVSDAGEETKDTLGAVSNVSTTTATAFSAARGDGRALIQTLGQMSPSLKAVGGTALGVSAGFVALFKAGEASLASFERSSLVLGTAADRIERIDVGGLSGSLSELATRAGSSDSALRNAASSAAQVGLSSGKSAAEVTEFANKVSALALRAVAMNPALGDAGNVAERLNQVLARGGRFLTRYGLDLTSAEITLRALSDTGKTSAADLTLFERSVAGADIAVEKLGANLGKDFDEGASKATLRLRALKTSIGDAFAEAGLPLVEPTLDGLESLAEAATELSKVLGNVGRAVLPVVATGLESVGDVAKVTADALGLIPGPVLAGGAAFLLFRNNILSFVKGLSAATTAAPSLINAVGGPALEASGTRATSTLRNVATGLNTVTGRSIIALGATVALTEGLKALGTSTEELGVEMVTTGAAVGFAIGGPQGAAIGALAGGVLQLATAESSLDKATAEVDESFKKAESSSGDLGTALFANADTAVELAAAIAGLDVNLGNFVRDASAFKGLHLNDDLRTLGLSASTVGQLAREGSEGLATFIDRAQKAGEVSVDLGEALASDLGRGASEVVTAHLRDTNEELEVLAQTNDVAAGGVLELRKRLDELGVGTRLTGEEFADLTKAQQRQVLIALRQHGANTDLIVAFQTLQKQIREAGKAEFELFASTNHLSPAIQRAARELSTAEDGTTDWAAALKVLGNAAVGIIPEFGRLTAQSALLHRELTGIIAATESAASSIPSFGSALTQALDSAFFEAGDNLTGKPLLDPEKLIGNVETATFDFGVFFGNIQKITEAGAGNVATALLALGPTNLGARVAAELAANEPLFREGMEKALEGMAKAQLVSESVLSSLKARATLLASIQGSEFEAGLQREFGEIDVSKLTNAQIIAFIQKFGDGGSPAAKEFVDKFNTEMAARKIAGLDTQPILDSIAATKAKIPAEAQGLIDVYTQTLDGTAPTVERSSKKLAAPIPQALEDIQPDVIAGISQVGDLLTTGAARATEEYERQFKVEQVTQKGMDAARGAISTAQTPITNAITGTVVGSIDDAGFSAGISGFGLGVTISQGIAHGIASDQAARDVQAAIDQQLDEIDAYFRAQAEAQSPAKRFVPIGEDISAGVGVGIGRGMTDVASQFRDMVGAVRGAAPGGLGGFGGTPVPPANLSPVVQVALDPSMLVPHMDRSTNIFGGINNYGGDADSRGLSTMRRLRDYAHLSGYGG